jgi:DNA-binding transcriptional MerR regulator
MAQKATIWAIDPAVLEHAVAPGPSAVPQSRGPDALDDDFLSIGEVAHRYGVTLRALRFYEAKRLISPQRQGVMRLYGRSDRERLRLILTGRRLGFTLAEIGQMLDRPDGKALPLTRAQCVAQINLLEQQKRGIEIAIAELRRIYTSFYRKLLDANAQSR